MKTALSQLYRRSEASFLLLRTSNGTSLRCALLWPRVSARPASWARSLPNYIRRRASVIFFVLAPNLTIYNKLIADFTPNTPKYVFKGIGEFAVHPPLVVTGDTYQDGRGVRPDEQLPGVDCGHICQKKTLLTSFSSISKRW
ncbi:MAG: hypothetical protein JW808_09235 [Victivallales bacterium]|nr:hypothetical protein [Victivallales bacterium]